MISGWSLAAVPLLIAMNAFFVASEYALVALRASQIEQMRQRGWRRSARAMELLKARPASSIGTIQVGITMANLLLGWIGEPAMSALLQWAMSPLMELAPSTLTAVSVGISFLLVTLLTVVFSELLPKALTLRFVPRVAWITGVPVLLMQQVCRPLVWVMNGLANLVTRPLGLGDVEKLEEHQVTIDELRLMTAEAAAGGNLTLRERSLVLNSLAMGRRTARQIMVPRTRVAYLDIQWSMEENRRVMNEYLYSRLPVCDGGLDHVIGIVHTKEFLSAYHAEGDSKVLSLIARAAVFVPETVSLDKLLSAFHEQRTEMVFLVDEYGGVEGIVTMQDVFDELLGEARAAGDHAAAATIEKSADGWLVSGDTPVHELARVLEKPEWGNRAGVATVGGLVVAELSRIPARGEELVVDGVHLRVLETDGKTVRRVQAMGSGPGPAC